MNKKPLILAFVKDGLFSTGETQLPQIDSFDIEIYTKVEDLLGQTNLEKVIVNQPGEPVVGQDASTFSQIVDRQPALILFDLDNELVNWRRWLPVLKSSPATRRIPIVAFAEVLDSDTRRVAKARGADVIGPRERVIKDLPQIAAKKGRIIDYVGIAIACSEPLSDHAIKGLELFNAREYFECHEELEHAWNDDQGPGRDLYRGILQVAVAYLQIERKNYNGAIKMMLRVKQWLDPLPDTCRTINVRKLRDEANLVHATLLQLGRDKIEEFDQSLFKPVEYGQE